MIHFEFSLYSKKYSKELLLNNYTIEYLNDWLSHESEIKYLFFFGDNEENTCNNLDIPDYTNNINDTICILRHNTILTNEEKKCILSLYIDDCYVINKNNIAVLHLIINSDYQKQPINEKIVKFLFNHIYNQTQLGIIKNGIIQPLSDKEKTIYNWNDELEWTNNFLENKTYENINHLDFLMLTDFTYIYQSNSLVKTVSKPIYISNYNLECYRLSKLIDSVNNDILRYKKSIKFLEKKKKELKKNKRHLYTAYRNNYIDMLSDTKKAWIEELVDDKIILTSPKSNKII